MILQRGKPVHVWGKSGVGETVTVTFAGQTVTAENDKAGIWTATLKPLQASAQPTTLTVKASNTIELKNVLVGDIWLCGGQSNMEYPLDRKLYKYTAPKKGNDIAAEEIEKTNKPAAIRYLHVEKKYTTDITTKGWHDGNDTLVRYNSAIGYFFAKEIYEQTSVPIGIITSAWGGSRIEPWIPDWAYANSPVFKDSAAIPNFKIDGTHPGAMFNSLIKPMVPFALKGFLWYQGESDLMIHDHATYPAKFQLLTDTWRSLFNDEKMPFYYVQIAPYLYTKRKDKIPHTVETLPEFWETQSSSLTLKNTGMAVTTDLVDDASNIHPSYKWTVAHRLALIALAKDYGQKKLEYSGPIYQSIKIKKGTVELKFSHANNGLKSNDGTPLSWFTIAGEDGKFVAATAEIKGNKVMVSSPEISSPTMVRFAWHETAMPNLVNAEGLPAQPFRTDK